jgi:hypothetical protein
MVAIDGVCGKRGFPGTHARDLILRKAIHLEIGEASVGIAEARFYGRRRLVGVDGLPLPPDGLQGVAEQHMQVRGPRRPSENVLRH